MIGLLTFALLALHVQAYVKSVKNCNGATYAIQEKPEDRVIGSLRIRAGHTIPFKVTVDVSEDIPAGGELVLILKKKVFGVFIQIPCLSNLGSCTYPVDCKILELLGMPCEIKKGVYPINHAVHIPSNFNLPNWIVGGDVQIKALARKGNKVYGCVDIEARLE